MNYQDLTSKTQDELVKSLLDLKKEQMELRFKHAGGQLDKVHELRNVRRNIAKVQTAMNAGQKPADAKKKTEAKKQTAKKTTAKSKSKAA